SAAGARYGNVFQILERVHAVLRCLSGNAVTNAGPWVQPKGGRSLEAPAQGNQQVAGDVEGSKTHLRRPGTVNVNLEPGQVERFLNPKVHRAGDIFKLTHQPIGESPIGGQVLAHHLDID